MVEQKLRYTRARSIFLVLFLLSTCLALVCGFFVSLTSRWMWGSADISDVLTAGGVAVAIISCPTSIITFIGFVSTTILIWRKEAREKEEVRLEAD